MKDAILSNINDPSLRISEKHEEREREEYTDEKWDNLEKDEF